MNVPDSNDYHPHLNAYLNTGNHARDAARQVVPGCVVAIDTETPSVTDSFTIKCVTAAYIDNQGRTVALLLDPLRRTDDMVAARVLFERAGTLVAHKSDFDVPGLVAAGVMTLDQCAKVVDTLIYARSAWSDELTSKSLENLAPKLLGTAKLEGGLKMAMAACGYRSREAWFTEADINIPFYRLNAMADTVVTLLLVHPLREAAIARQLDHPFSSRGLTTRAEAEQLIDREQQVNRVMLRRSAYGFEVDLDYLDNYRDSVESSRAASEKVLTEIGLRPGVGLDIATHLESIGELPSDWPRTAKTGRPSSAKGHFERLKHPLADAHRHIAHSDKILGYLEKVVARSRVTGRLHPQVGILGACKSGRTSYGEPELQQFPEEARPIILADTGRSLSSVDWSSIEPCLMGWLSNDRDFMAPFEAGADLYQPITEICKVPRKLAKVMLLAALYGQGKAKRAAALGCSQEEADAMQRRMFSAFPQGARFMSKLAHISDIYGLTITLSGRILTIPKIEGQFASYKAVNYFCQGGNADLLYESIVEAERRGLGDYVYLLMHDEIVCDNEAASEMNEIMRRPIPAFQRWTDHTPRIRTDVAHLGRSWQAC